MRRLTVQVSGCVLVLAVLSGTARAEFVTEVKCLEFGVALVGNPSSTPPIGSSFGFGSGIDSAVLSINGAYPGYQVPAPLDMGGTVTSYQVGPLGITYSLSGGSTRFELIFYSRFLV